MLITRISPDGRLHTCVYLFVADNTYPNLVCALCCLSLVCRDTVHYNLTDSLPASPKKWEIGPIAGGRRGGYNLYYISLITCRVQVLLILCC